jgi:1,4-dihydroxy-2-naphthoyl-CoA hydrolase
MDKSELIKNTVENELMQFLGVEIVEASAERVVLTMPVTPKVHQYVGIMNGGVSLYLFETAASIGVVVSSDLTKVTPVGIEINANHMRAVSKGVLTTTATPIRHGRTMSVWKIENHDDRGRLVCTGRISILLQNRPAFPKEN